MSKNEESSTGKKQRQSSTQSPPKDVKLGDGLKDVVYNEINEGAKRILKQVIHSLFDYIDSNIKNVDLKDIPQKIKQLRNSSETEEVVYSQWSEQLYAQGIVPKGYRGLPDNLLIHNFHQEGYIDGLYAGHLFTLTVLEDLGIPKEVLRNAHSVFFKEFPHHNRFDERNDWIDQLKARRQMWYEPKGPTADLTSEPDAEDNKTK